MLSTLLALSLLSDVNVAGGQVNVRIEDGGVILLDANRNPLQSIEDGHLSVSQDTTLVSDRAIGTTLNTNVWTGNVTNFTTTVTGGGFYTLNGAAATTASSTAQIQTLKLHSVGYTDLPISGVAVAKVTNLPIANAVAQLGFFAATALTNPTDGCYFEWNATGEFRAVTNFNGTVNQSGVLTSPSANIVHVFTVMASYDECAFSVDGTQVAVIGFANVGSTQPILSAKLPYAARVTVPTASTPTLAPVMNVASVTTYISATNINMPGPHQLAGGGRGAWQNPLTTYGKTANWTASTAPTTRTLTATTTASETTLCGLVTVTPTTTANADYILFDYTVPTGLQLRVTSVTCDFTVAGAAQVATALGLQWWVATNSSATTLATADALGPPPTAWGPRPIFFGASSLAASAAIGAGPTYHSARLDLGTVPLVVDSARHFQVGFRALQTQTATASEVLAISCACPGYFE